MSRERAFRSRSVLFKVEGWSQRDLACGCHFGSLTIKMFFGGYFCHHQLFTLLFYFFGGLKLVHSPATTPHSSFDSHYCVTEFHLPRPLILLFASLLSDCVVWEVQRGPVPVWQISPPLRVTEGCRGSWAIICDVLHRWEKAIGVGLSTRLQCVRVQPGRACECVGSNGRVWVSSLTFICGPLH